MLLSLSPIPCPLSPVPYHPHRLCSSPRPERHFPARPKFQSRTQITAQFFEKSFKEKAARLGVSIEWIDIGTWQLPPGLTTEQISEKHKKAWELARDNTKKRNAVERSKRRREVAEIAELVNEIIIKNYEKNTTPRKLSEKEIEKYLLTDPEYLDEYRQRLFQRGGHKNSKAIALDILKAFRKEMNAGKSLIENENRAPDEKQADLARITKAIQNISLLVDTPEKKQ